MKTIKILLIFSVALSTLKGFSQDYNGVDSMIQYEDTILRTVKKFDTNGNVIFSLSNRMFGPVVMMSASYYNNQNKKIRTITAHSNIGFSINESEFDSFGNEILIYTYKELIEEDGGYNYKPYEYIEHYRSREDLENDSSILAISKGEKYIQTEKMYDKDGNLLQETLFKENGDTANICTYEYDLESNRTKYSSKNSFLGNWDYYYKYDSNGNKISSKRIDYKGDTTEIHIYEYDTINNLITDVFYRKGVLKYTTVYIYENSHLKRIKSLDENNELWRTRDFSLNSKGYKLTENYTRIDKYTHKSYFWKYIYY